MNLAEFEVSKFQEYEKAVMAAVTYADIFDYPLTSAEIHRFLVGKKIALSELQSLLDSHLVPTHLAHDQGYYFRIGRSEVVATRARREQTAATLWPLATRYGKLLSNLPFVRMVAVTGSLAVNNADTDADIDYFVVTTTGRLWLCRAMTILLVRYAQRRGVTLCPNYFISENALNIEQQTLYTARELAQMVPIFGYAIYNELLEHNEWATHLLPNAGLSREEATHHVTQSKNSSKRSLLKSVAERLLQTKLGGWLEAWEQRRKIARFTARGASSEAMFSATMCKGHFDEHSERVMSTFNNRLEQINNQ